MLSQWGLASAGVRVWKPDVASRRCDVTPEVEAVTVALGILSRRPYSLNIAVSDVYIPWWNRAVEIVVCGQIYLCSVWCVIYFQVCVLKLLKTQSLVLC